MALTPTQLDRLPQGVDAPPFERGKITAGIAHIGVGAFHRAHLAIYTNHTLADPDMASWGILGINLLDHDKPLAEALKAQQGLYSVSEFDPRGDRKTHVVGAMVDYLYAPAEGATRVLQRLADPAIRIVSLTITEGGYLIDENGNFRLDDETVKHDLANPDEPRGAFGFIVGALAKRRAAGVDPFTVMSCDNLRHNGAQAKKAVLAYARARSPELATWIDAQVDFPNGMVDRITPATTPAVRDELNKATGLTDEAPVVCEDFIQWVLEDKFRHGRPAWERHGVQIVDDVSPYEDAKIRLLNGSHQMLSYPAFLSGHRRVDVAVKDPLFNAYLTDFLNDDAGIWLKSLPGMDLGPYKKKLLDRFSNASIADQLDRLCLDGGSKIPGFLGPTITACLEHGKDARRLAFLLAAFDRYVRVGKDDDGETYPLREPNAMRLVQPLIDSGSKDTLIESVELVGPLPAKDTRFRKQYDIYVDSLQKQGVRKTLEQLDSLVD
ncbi:mannitol dehydrogenase family protein [Luteibacter aegosomaticola]|uniref:mannitol dehydrogenase family protein n=1 Tax=Luteibacter aegosomaticola TaxID=2911538 RepID=UPI001FF7095F|nr:mannitol dehydrogenase family protein [Luteibacter aegosomaticola]UPG89910.1 mannitol dehydrogenase family protein [Luteibacter aegosomaticola]